MKHLIAALITITLLCVGTNIQAQSVDGAIRIGAHLGYGTDIESLGIGARMDYALSPAILIAPDFMYYFGSSDLGVDFNWLDININGNYLFEINNRDLVPYALAGLNIADTSLDCNNLPGVVCEDRTDLDMGFNLGGGMDYYMGDLVLFGELRVTVGNASQLVIMSGIKYLLN